MSEWVEMDPDPYWNQGDPVPNMGGGCFSMALGMLGGLLGVWACFIAIGILISWVLGR